MVPHEFLDAAVPRPRVRVPPSVHDRFHHRVPVPPVAVQRELLEHRQGQLHLRWFLVVQRGPEALVEHERWAGRTGDVAHGPDARGKQMHQMPEPRLDVLRVVQDLQQPRYAQHDLEHQPAILPEPPLARPREVCVNGGERRRPLVRHQHGGVLVTGRIDDGLVILRIVS
eukprot:6212434-Pleurochrysis_carterae.AAC.1